MTKQHGGEEPILEEAEVMIELLDIEEYAKRGEKGYSGIHVE